jgi:hypothetical protein
LDAEPDIARFLDPEDLAAARRLAVPLLSVAEDGVEDLGPELEQSGAFGAIIIDGVVLRQLVVGDQLGMTLLGPGDLILVGSDPPSMLVGESLWRAVARTRLAVLGREFLLAARRWPSLFAGLELRSAQQIDRLTTQLVVCQLPRVDQRVLALMWLLAESWGHVTPTGTTLPLSVTHDAIGALVGARRPTVTLALRELTDRGAILRQEQGWLLVEPPPQPVDRVQAIRAPAMNEIQPSMWAVSGPVTADGHDDEQLASFYASVLDTVTQLRKQHERNQARYREYMTRMRRTRERCRDSRERLARDRLKRLRPPAS